MKKNGSGIGMILKKYYSSKLNKIMRLSLLFFFFGALNLIASNSYSQNTRISLDVNQTSISDVLSEIESQSEFYFLYNNKLVDISRKVDIHVQNKKIKDILDDLLTETDVSYMVMDRQIVLSPKYMLAKSSKKNAALQQEQITITGKVTDENGVTIPGVNVSIKGTPSGTITDANGQYTLNIDNPNATLVFSFIGYKSEEVIVGGRDVINMVMKEEAIGLEEVVSIGYATQKKATLTGSIVTTDNKKLKRSPAISVSNSMAGLLPGVIALNRSGEPGADYSTILIRGLSTTGSNAPLVVVDGVQNPAGWQRINPNDIKLISVLKDASAAIYGARAANGVILITTKRGKIGKPIIDYNFNMGINKPTRVPDMACSATFAEYENQRLEELGNDPKWTDEEIQKFRDGTDPNYLNTDWYGEVLKSHSFQQMHHLSVRGGNETTQYSVSGSYSNSNSMFNKGMHNYKGYSIRSNFDTKVTKYIGVHLDINAGLDDRTRPGSSDGPWLWLKAIPMMPVYYKPGYPSAGIEQGLNPAVMVTNESGEHKISTKRFSSKFGFDVKLPWVKGLGFDGYFVYNTTGNMDKQWQTPWIVYNYDKDNNEYIPFRGGRLPAPDLNQSSSAGRGFFGNLRITYERQFNKHYISAFFGAEQSTGKNEFIWAYRRNYMSKLIPELSAGAADTQRNSGSSSNYARQSLIGRLSYNFQEKYLLDFNARYDGSYRFAKGNRFGFFPGVSVAWRLKKENFLADVSSINELKIRASIGQMGNDMISPFQYLSTYSLSLGEGYHFGVPVVSDLGLRKGVTANPNITWEVATNMNLGVDGVLWDNLLGFSIDFFKHRRSNILTKRNLEVPFYTGIVLPDENIGIVENRGVELVLSHWHKPSTVDGFTYSVSGNIALAKSKVIDLSEAQDVPDYQKAKGHILGAGIYYEALGIIRTQEQLNSLPLYPGSRVGDLYYKDIDGNGEIDAADRVRMDKSNIPNLTFGFNFNIGYKGFSLYANFSGQGNAWQYFHQYARISENGLEDLLANRYTPGSMDSKYPILPTIHVVGVEPSSLRSTFWLQNAAFLRFKTLELGYDFPENIASKMGLSTLRIYLNGNNLFVLSQIKWFDPETNNEAGTYYPQNKIFNLGINLSF
jgi:TonB-linked SusC/RagA family outer membrane protein